MSTDCAGDDRPGGGWRRARYRKLAAGGKKPTVVVTAIARELSGFVWAIGQTMRPETP